jgi:hypothetical protein
LGKRGSFGGIRIVELRGRLRKNDLVDDDGSGLCSLC